MKIRVCFIVILIALQACVPLSQSTPPFNAPSPTYTPYVGGTETAQAPVSTLTALPMIPPPSATPSAPMEPPGDFSPVLYGGKLYDTPFFLLLGGVNTNLWLSPEMSVARYGGEATYSLHSMTQEYKYFLWGKSPEFSPTCPGYFVGTDAALDESGFVAVFDGWSITKRPVTELAPDGDYYQNVVLDWLASEGVGAPKVGSLQTFRVDIEGDGVDEIFISATRLDDSQHTTKSGDYSIVLMRKVQGNDVLTIPVVKDIYYSQELEITFPRTYSAANFIDLNQDGVLEVVLEIRGWEKFGAIIYQIDDGDVIQTLRAEC